MKKILYIFISICLFIGCSLDEPDIPKIVEDSIVLNTNDKLILGQKSCSVEIKFTSSGKWNAAVASGATAWCNVDNSHGTSGANTIIATVSENTSYDERNASITITSGTTKQIITITQKQKDALIVTSNKVELNAGGGNFSIEAQANVKIDYEIDEKAKSWLRDNVSRSLSTTTFSFTADANESLERREGSIYIKGDNGLTETVKVYQEGEEPCLVLTCNDSLIVGSEGSILKVELRSNIEYEMVMPNVDWIKEANTRAVSTYTHYLEIAPNVNYESREAILVVKSKDCSISDSLNIIQSQKDAIVIARTIYNVTSDENVLDLRVNTNVNFETEISVDWISKCDNNTTRSLSENRLLLKIEKNPTEIERTGVVFLKYEGIVQKITISQDGRTDKMKIVLTHSENVFLPLDFQGNIVSGTVDWGDGTKSDLKQGHSFLEMGEKTTIYEVMGVGVFSINNLNTISSIAIFCNEGKDGTTEDFEIEDKEWD